MLQKHSKKLIKQDYFSQVCLIILVVEVGMKGTSTSRQW